MAEENISETPYSYVLNSPVNYIDPFGLWEMDAHGGYTTSDPNEIGQFIDNLVRMYGNDSGGEMEENYSEPEDVIYALSSDGELVELTKMHLWVLGMYHSEQAMQAAIDYWADGSLKSSMKMMFTEIGAQWMDPFLLLNGAMIFTFSLPHNTNILKNIIYIKIQIR